VVNQYTAIGGVNRTHDNNGNLVDDGTYLFGYDFRNRLVEVRLKSTQALVSSYRYDALGRRVEKAVSGGATTRYVLDGVEVVEEFDGSGTWQANYVYEDGIDQPRSMDRADIADVNGNQNTQEVLRFHYHQQALGSVTEMTDYTGAVCEWVTYDVYGLPQVLNQQGSAISQSAIGNPWLYTGREFDPESGLYHYRARAYDPKAGRFLQRDPAGYVDGLGLYGYASDCPSSRLDPLGLDDDAGAATRALKSAAQALKRADEATRAGDIEGARLWNAWAEFRVQQAYYYFRLSNLTVGNAVLQGLLNGLVEYFTPDWTDAASFVVSVIPQLRALNAARKAERRIARGAEAAGDAAKAGRSLARPKPPPRLDRSGKIHGKLPGHVPENWTREQLEKLAQDLRSSIARRKAEQACLGEHGPHRHRIHEEELLLRAVEKVLSGS
jgi:RHS repeat-associated protein